MQPTNLTLEERERWAYANGDVQEAKLLGEAVDDAYANGYEDGRADERDQG